MFIIIILYLNYYRFYASLDRKQEACDILMTAYEIGADFSTQEKVTLLIKYSHFQ